MRYQDAPAAIEWLCSAFGFQKHLVVPGENGTITLTTDYPDFYPVQRYAEDSETRKALYEQFMSRAYPANVSVLQDVLKLRYEQAQLLGHPHWASYNAEDKMVKSSEAIEAFIEQIEAQTVMPQFDVVFLANSLFVY